MCPRGLGKMKRPVGFMPSQTLERLFAEVKPEQRMLRLHHFGEPLLNKQLPALVKLTRSAGLIPLISVNPSSLSQAMADELINSGVGIVCFSLDSLRSERLYAIRGITKPASYCLELIDYFIKSSMAASYPILSVIQMVSLDINQDERDTFLALKEKYPGKDVFVYITANYGFGDIELVKHTDSKATATLPSETPVCNAPFDDVVIMWNGDVALCCYDYDGFNVIGNLNKASLGEIWHGKQAEAIRKIFIDGKTDRLPLCRQCYLAPHNNLQSNIKNIKRGYNEENYIMSLYDQLVT